MTTPRAVAISSSRPAAISSVRGLSCATRRGVNAFCTKRRSRVCSGGSAWSLLRLVAAGHTNSQIARRLGISEGTVRTHLENIYENLNVSSRTAAVTRAFSS